MITLSERDKAVEKIHYRLVDVLLDWMVKEKRNLDLFIANPEGHVNYDPYIIPDFNALRQRSYMLGVIAESLEIISAYKKGQGYTRTQHDSALNRIPSIILSRQVAWMEKRISDMEKSYPQYDKVAPLEDYVGLMTFDKPKFLEELAMYKDSLEGLRIFTQYQREQEALRVAPPEEEEPIDEEPTGEPIEDIEP